MPNDFERTQFYGAGMQPTPPRQNASNLSMTLFDCDRPPRTINFLDFRRGEITLGRVNGGNDIELTSPFVSHKHGVFVYYNGRWHLEDVGSKNGIYYNGMRVNDCTLGDGDAVQVYDNGTNAQGVLMVFSEGGAAAWQQYPEITEAGLNIGRAQNNDITLPHVAVSKHHATVFRSAGAYWIRDNNSTNGTFVNGQLVRGRHQLLEKDIVTIANTRFVFFGGTLYCNTQRSGIRLDAYRIVKAVGPQNKRKIICNDVSLSINPCEMVAIIGGSGAGKTTIMNCISGYSIPTKGKVFVNGMDLYKNYNAIKNIIGYVPQQDIVYDGLTVTSMLDYAAKLRLPVDTSPEERKQAIARVLDMVDLTERKDTMIKSLSGGQKKRASIAVELLSDPNLFFLDEPASGLDPGTERSLMRTLKKTAAGGKTVIMVTHSTLNLKMFDKIVFMGKGGNLCFCGNYDEACAFFGVTDLVDVYNMITDDAPGWRQKYDAQRRDMRSQNTAENEPLNNKGKSRNALLQLPVLCKRYINLIINDRARLLLMIGLAPLLTLLVAAVNEKGEMFNQFENTQAIMFSFACASYFVGTLNSIQEICKERNILRREFMTGLKLSAYVSSKIIVLAIISLIQAITTTSLFALILGLPNKGLIFKDAPYFDIFITVFLTAWASTAIGIAVSAMVKNPDRAMTIAPLLLMPQILFAGVIFKLKNATEVISWLVACRFSMECLGSISNLNDMEHKLIQKQPQLAGVWKPEIDDMYKFAADHVWKSWAILLIFVIGFSVLAWIFLNRIKSERK